MTQSLNNTRHLILGGTRSGKSRYAEKTILSHILDSSNTLQKAYYIATAEELDDEMSARIKRHQLDRSKNENNYTSKGQTFKWHVIEEPINIAETLKQFSSYDSVLIECLTLWISNCIHHQCWHEQKNAFIKTLKETKAHIVMVSNEVGQGIVPSSTLGREFIDESGWLHQELADICEQVSFVTAGLVRQLK